MSLTLAEARVRSALVHDVHTTVHLDLSSTTSVRVEATLTFGCRRAGADTFVELAGATDVVAQLTSDTGSAGSVVAADGRLRLSGLAGPGSVNTLTVQATLPYVTDGDGITSLIDAADGQRYVCTYTAMDIAQRVLPCFDQPDLKSTFTVSVTGESHWSVLANGRFASRTGNTWSFEPTPPIPSYLFFVAAGPWVSRTWQEPYALAEGGSLPFGWHARASQAPALDREFDWLRALTSAAFTWYTETFDEPYAFADYQQVFTPGLNWGAMEFPGCVAFRDEYLTPGEPTAIQRQQLSSVICHEMAHMWFGNLVTMQWWEDSWLNESFADHMGYRVSGETGFSTGWTMAALTRKPTAYAADSRRSTHPIAEDAENLVDVDTAFANFDMITYAKGNAVLHQLVAWLGVDTFLAGVNAHLSAHRFGNATLADFLDALDAVTDRDVRGWAQVWLRSTGFDTLRLRTEDGVPTLTCIGSRPHRVTVVGHSATGAEVRRAVVDLARDPVPLPEFAGLLVLPNAEDDTYAALDLDEATWHGLVSVLATGSEGIGSTLTRALLWTVAVRRVGSGQDSLASLAALAREALPRESDPTVFEGALDLVLACVRRHAHPSEVADLLAVLSDLARQVLASGPDTHQGAAGRLLGATGSDAALLGTWLSADSGLLAQDQELRWAVVQRVVELGDSRVIAAEQTRDRSVAGRYAALRATAAVPDPDAKARAWQGLVSGDLSNREFLATAHGFWGIDQGSLVRDWVVRAPADFAEVAHRSGQGMGQVIGKALPVLPLDTATATALAQALADVLHGGSASGPVPTVAARWFNDHLDDLRAMLAARQRRQE